jgi:hypothetical protein
MALAEQARAGKKESADFENRVFLSLAQKAAL